MQVRSKPVLYLCAILFASLLMSCKSESQNPTSPIAEGGENTTEYTGVRAEAAALIDHRAKTSEAQSSLTSGYWAYEFVFDGDKMSEPHAYDGHWLDFKEDHTYDYGFYDESNGNGKYHYRMDDYMLIMLDNDANVEPREWQVKQGGDVIVLVGSHGFGNNAMQMKLRRLEAKPVNAETSE